MNFISGEDKSKILEKHKKLTESKNTLKKEFIGLDEVIDEVCNLVEPWYLFPNAQIRPTVINLWGMTGVGKTSLVVRLFELLELNSLLRFDTGEWIDKSDFQLTNKISGQIRKLKKDNMIPIFMFDEFQLGRTIDDNGDEIDRPQLRVVWDLLDSGKFSLIEEKWEVNTVMKLYSKLSHLLTDKKVEVNNGVVTKNKEHWDIIFLEDLEDDLIEKNEDFLTKYYSKNAFIPSNKLWNIKSINSDFYSEVQIAEYLMSLNGNEILDFLERSIEKGITPVLHDFSDSIVFIVGNLDSSYYNSTEMSPDIDPDTLYEHTEEINISDIKNSLKFLYRPEQISRLGNNHVIYKSFNEKMYNELITLELDKVVKKVKSKFDIEIKFDKSVNNLIYKEGVFPTQGVRPIFSTITSLVESYVGRIIVDIMKLNFDAKTIRWKYSDEKYSITLKSKDRKKGFKYPIKLKVESVRKSKSDDIQSLVAIHESGHIVTAVYSLNILPKVAASRTADDKGGYTHVDVPVCETKDYLTKNIITLIGGYCAERMVFGEENLTTGSFSDLERTTKTALKMIKDYGMNGIPLLYSTPDFRISDVAVCLNDDEIDKKAVKLVKECMVKTEKILNDNMELLLRLGQYLTNNSKIESEQINEFVEKYGKEKPKYKTKDNFYEYKSILEDKLKKYEK